MFSKLASLSLVALMTGSLLLVGCGLLESNDPVTGRVIVHLTDEPLEDFTEVYVTISRVDSSAVMTRLSSSQTPIMSLIF
jgi:hypothetical protein